MKKFYSAVIDTNGNCVPGAWITVYIAGTTNKATIYVNESSVIKNNPFTADEQGRFDFYVDDGDYDIEISGGSILTYKLQDITLVDAKPAAQKAHDRKHPLNSASDHTSTIVTGKMLKADSNGLPVEATNSDVEVSDAVTKRHIRLHNISSNEDHSSTVPENKLFKANAKGLPVEATNTDTEVAEAVAKRHNKQHSINSSDHTSTITPGQILIADINGLPSGGTNTNTEVSDAVSRRHDKLHPINSADNHTSLLTPEKMLKADANGLPAEATNTDNEVSDAVARRHNRTHPINSADDHSSLASPGKIFKADTNGLPVEGTSTDIEVSDAVAKRHDGTVQVVGPSSAVDGNVPAFDGTTGKLIKDSGKPVADLVRGPASASDLRIAVFDGNTGKLVKDGGSLIADLIAKSIGTTKGDIIAFTANGAPTRLGVGYDGHVLTADPSQPSGLKWAIANSYPKYIYTAGCFEAPVNADWKINAFPGLDADASNNALLVYPFDDTTEEGVGFQLRVPVGDPAGPNFMIIRFVSRAKTAPTVARGVAPKLYFRKIGNNEEIGTWSTGYELNKIDLPTNTYYQYDEQTIPLDTLSLMGGKVYQFELTRNPGSANDDLVGDWYLLEMEISFL